MRHLLSFLPLLLAAPTAAPLAASAASSAETQSPQAAVDALIAADRAFAAAASGKDARDAVAAMLRDDAVMFIVPQPPVARGKAAADALLKAAFPDPSTITWTAVRGGVSADGAHGFTYGFTTRTLEGTPPELGKYVAYWTKGADGWRAAALKIVPRAEGEVPTALRTAALPARIVPVSADAALSEKYRKEVDAVERRFSDEAQVIGLGAAFAKYGSADAVNVGGDADFTTGNEEIAKLFGTEKGSPLRWAPDGVLAASSGDLGLTYGYLERNGPTPPGRLARIPWFTIWRRAAPDQPWLYVAE